MALNVANVPGIAGFLRLVDGFTGSGQGQGINSYGQELEGRKPTYSAYISRKPTYSAYISRKPTYSAYNDKAFVLRTASQQIALNGFGAALPAGSVFEIGITWSEESLTGN